MKRLECLDGLRGVLAVYVLLGHMAPFALLPPWLLDRLAHGGAAVDLFFVLSGLVIAQSLLRARGRAAPFLIARAARIFPVFLIVFVPAVIIEPFSCGFERMPWLAADSAARMICPTIWPPFWLPELLAHLSMTHGLFPAAILPDVWVTFLGAAWSLSTEWQFYILALLIVARGQPRPRPAASPPPAETMQLSALCWTLLALASAAVAWRLLMPEAWHFSRAFLPNKAHFFALGVASVPVITRRRGATTRYVLVSLAALLICATEGSIGKLLPPAAWTLCLLVQMRSGTIGLASLARLLRSPAAQYLGAISYSLYLVNEPIHKLLANLLSHVAGGDAAVFTMLWLPLAIGLPMLAAGWLHTHLEVPALRWGRAVAYRA